jgi:hypothetical protein
MLANERNELDAPQKVFFSEEDAMKFVREQKEEHPELSWVIREAD